MDTFIVLVGLSYSVIIYLCENAIRKAKEKERKHVAEYYECIIKKMKEEL